ncbi:MAG TPA: VOC family protein [Pyrinomonadaceae bacterium]|nr:VOC family protein [Pyrinomonadaceae bacterium]
MNKLSLISLIVKDYDAALEFYTKKLGFEVAEDAAFGDRRWITLKLPNTPDSAINLELAKSKGDEALVGKQAGGFPLLGLGTDDCLGDYQRMKELGVTFHGEPTSGPWGTGVLLEDLYGNKIFMSQES